MRILITGGAGCLGSNLIEYFLPKGYNILVIDNFSTGHREVVPEMDRLKIIEGSIVDAELVNKAFEEFKPTHVIHSAASYKDPDDWLEDVATNVVGTINVIKASQVIGVKRFVNFQTALCYGQPDRVPIPNDAALQPNNSYSISKTSGEHYLSLSKLNFVSIRLASVIGPRLSIGPIPTFYSRLRNNQNCFCTDTVRDFIDINDFFSFMEIAMKEDAPCGYFNLSSGIGHTIKEIFDIVINYLALVLDEPVKIIPAGNEDIRTVILDSSETEKVFSWKAEIDFKETVINMLKWYDKYGVNNIYSHLRNNKY